MKYSKDIFKYPSLILFTLFILGLSLFDLIIPNKYMSEFENRVLQQKPSASLESIFNGTYTTKYEKYINDQFVFRNSWIDIKAETEKLIGKQENNGIVFGKDGYLFEIVDTIPQKSQARIKQNTKFLKQYIENYPDVNMTVTLVPNSYTIYNELVPTGIPSINQTDEIQNIYNELNLPNVTAVNLYETLFPHKQEYIYYKTDHHWTTLGAYYAYKQFVQSKGLNPVDIESLEPNIVEDFYGTYYSKAKLSSVRPDYITYYTVPVEHFEYETARTDSLYDFSKFETRDKYAAFMFGNNGLTYIKSNNTETVGKPRKLLVIKDSYANSIIPFLTYNYDEIYVVDLRGLPQNMSKLMEDNKFDDVLILYNFMNFMNDTNFLRLTK